MGGQTHAIAPVPPAPAQPEATMLFNAVTEITRGANAIGNRVPEAAPMVAQILEAVDQMQALIIKALPPREVAAPPV